MELKEGMYVRFEQVLCKIDEIEDNYIHFDKEFYDHWAEPTMSMHYDRFADDYKPRYSYNIIDLIEVGDYVNGKKVIKIVGKNIFGNKNVICSDDDLLKITDRVMRYIYTNDGIKSIVTKEQFESMEYKVC